MKIPAKAITYLVFILIVISSCATRRKLVALHHNDTPQVQLSLGTQPDFLKKISDTSPIAKDTIKVKDEDGREMILMKAIKDEETGDMVAADVLKAASITARFRNVAERNGKVDLAFQVIVPDEMMDSKWQLRFYPDMYVLGDSIRLDPVIITGTAYRRNQMRGYQLYDKFLAKITDDSTKFINVRQLELFLKRYIPEVYAYKNDTSFVSEKEFYSSYGVSQRQAVGHYTNKYAKKLNDKRKARMDKMYRKYVKVPIVTEGIRLDSVIVNAEGEFVYNYVQTINTRPKLRKADIVLSGEIYEQEERIYTVPRSEPLTFYISSISAFVDNKEKYLTKIVERRANANTECRIDFEVGKSEIKEEYGENGYEIKRIKETLASLAENTVFELDSITVSATASPEGSYDFNKRLALQRSESVSEYFRIFVRQYQDSIQRNAGFAENLDDTYSIKNDKKPVIDIIPVCIPENWDDLNKLVYNDIVMNASQKESFFAICDESDLDMREVKLKKCPYYEYLKEVLFPKLRTVKFNFYLHRKGMVKDTVHTTVLDSTYMKGVQAVKDMDYAAALSLLRPYSDFNTAIAYMGLDRNANAMRILSGLEKTGQVNYLLAILYSRAGNPEKAVECYLSACKDDPSYRFRGNLDPEISALIKTYGLNDESENEMFE